MPSRIEDDALIGDLGTAALVGRDGSIDWLCWPHFDSEAAFAALLGEPKNGRARIAPKDKTARVTRRYRSDTLILETRFETADGVATLIDFMPPRSGEGFPIWCASSWASAAASNSRASWCCASATAPKCRG